MPAAQEPSAAQGSAVPGPFGPVTRLDMSPQKVQVLQWLGFVRTGQWAEPLPAVELLAEQLLRAMASQRAR